MIYQIGEWVVQTASPPLSLSCYAFAFVMGAVAGSFLGVIVVRLPRILISQAQHNPEVDPPELGFNMNSNNWTEGETQAPFNLSYLAFPRSHCMHCKQALQVKQNIPILSYLALKGKCGFCEKPIKAWHFWIELLCALWWVFCAFKYGSTWTSFAYCIYGSALICLAFMDWQTTLLADAITYPVLWGGLVASSLGVNPLPLGLSLWGAVLGYTSLWLISRSYLVLRGKLGLGDGDLKLVAAIGAWCGAAPLIWLMLFASLGGIVVALILKLRDKLDSQGLIPFGPFLVGSALFIAVLEVFPQAASLFNFSSRF
jgi:leader peptidase (prepilin peptidase)/N-methyltransferase